MASVTGNESAHRGKSTKRSRLETRFGGLSSREENIDEFLIAVERLLQHLAHHVPAEGVHLEHIKETDQGASATMNKAMRNPDWQARKAKRDAEGSIAWMEYVQRQRGISDKIAKLRALRLARDQGNDPIENADGTA